MNIEELEEQLTKDAIGSTLYSKKWVIEALERIKQNPDEHIQDLESISEMSTDQDVASFLAFAQLDLLDILKANQVSFRAQEVTLVILANMLRQDFAMFRYEASAIDIPKQFLLRDFDQDPDFVQVLIVTLQYLTIFNDCLMERPDFDEELDQIEHNFRVAPNVTLILASTLNPDLLHKSSR